MSKIYYLVCGSRGWYNKDIIKEFISIIPNSWTMIEGECPVGGADAIAKELAYGMNKKVKKVSARWKQLGKKAGPIRNTIMVNHGPKFGIAFHNNLKDSKGTKDVVDKMKRKDIPVFVVTDTLPPYEMEQIKKDIRKIISDN